MCVINLSGVYQRFVKTHSIVVERIDMMTAETLFSKELMVDQHEIPKGEVDFNYTTACSDLLADDSILKISGMEQSGWIPGMKKEVTAWTVSAALL